MSRYQYSNAAKTTVLDTDTGLYIPTQDGMSPDYFSYRSWIDLGNTPDPYVEPIITLSLERLTYENKYLQATKQLMQLAGQTVAEGEWPKLSDAEFETVAIAAATANPGMTQVLLATLNWTLTVLKYDLNVKWEEITYHS
jgi:hypothetical protein